MKIYQVTFPKIIRFGVGALDTLSVGGTLAFAMECYQNGIIAEEDLGEIELTWGNPCVT